MGTFITASCCLCLTICRGCLQLQRLISCLKVGFLKLSTVLFAICGYVVCRILFLAGLEILTAMKSEVVVFWLMIP
jgi:hypothetical protein